MFCVYKPPLIRQKLDYHHKMLKQKKTNVSSYRESKNVSIINYPFGDVDNQQTLAGSSKLAVTRTENIRDFVTIALETSFLPCNCYEHK